MNPPVFLCLILVFPPQGQALSWIQCLCSLYFVILSPRKHLIFLCLVYINGTISHSVICFILLNIKSGGSRVLKLINLDHWLLTLKWYSILWVYQICPTTKSFGSFPVSRCYKQGYRERPCTPRELLGHKVATLST